MKAIALALVLASGSALAADPPLYSAVYFRSTLNFGTVPYFDGGGTDLTLDFGAHTFDGPFSTGLSTSFSSDLLSGRWFVLDEGLFVQLDLVYLVATAFWSHPPPTWLPFRAELGIRVALAVSESFPPRDVTPFASPYFLVRPEMRTFLDIEIPLGSSRRRALVIHGAIDSPVTFTRAYSNAFRWSAGVGVSWGWGDG